MVDPERTTRYNQPEAREGIILDFLNLEEIKWPGHKRVEYGPQEVYTLRSVVSITV